MDTDIKRLEAAIAKQVRIELVERDMTQATLADAMGIERATLNRYLMGRTSMTARTFFALAQALGVTASGLLGKAQEHVSTGNDDQTSSAEQESGPRG